MLVAVQEANNAIAAAKRAFDATAKHLLPAGTTIRWKRGNAVCFGSIVRHVRHNCVLVENNATGRRYTIGVTEIRNSY